MTERTLEQLSCQELVELVTDYLEGALAPADAERFEAHVATCDGCGVYLEQLRQVIRASGRLAPDTLAPEAERELREAFRGWRAARDP
jgi:anti-sigma factor RsiW